MNTFNHTPSEAVNFRIREIEYVIGYIKTHINSGKVQWALKESENLQDEVSRLTAALNTLSTESTKDLVKET